MYNLTEFIVRLCVALHIGLLFFKYVMLSNFVVWRLQNFEQGVVLGEAAHCFLLQAETNFSLSSPTWRHQTAGLPTGFGLTVSADSLEKRFIHEAEQHRNAAAQASHASIGRTLEWQLVLLEQLQNPQIIPLPMLFAISVVVLQVSWPPPINNRARLSRGGYHSVLLYWKVYFGALTSHLFV